MPVPANRGPCRTARTRRKRAGWALAASLILSDSGGIVGPTRLVGAGDGGAALRLRPAALEVRPQRRAQAPLPALLLC
jgi:hypothetical protein